MTNSFAESVESHSVMLTRYIYIYIYINILLNAFQLVLWCYTWTFMTC